MDPSESSKNKKEDESSSSQPRPVRYTIIDLTTPSKESIENESDIKNGERQSEGVWKPVAIIRRSLQHECSASNVHDDKGLESKRKRTISSYPANDDSHFHQECASASQLNIPAPLLQQEDVQEFGDSDEMVPPSHLPDLSSDVQNMLKFYGSDQDGNDEIEVGSLIDNPSAYQRLLEDHFPNYLKEYVTTIHRQKPADTEESTTQLVQNQPIFHIGGRKKPGCACSKTRCLKTVCGCVAIKVACSTKCKCRDCGNSYGRKQYRKKGGNVAKPKVNQLSEI